MVSVYHVPQSGLYRCTATSGGLLNIGETGKKQNGGNEQKKVKINTYFVKKSFIGTYVRNLHIL